MAFYVDVVCTCTSHFERKIQKHPSFNDHSIVAKHFSVTFLRKSLTVKGFCNKSDTRLRFLQWCHKKWRKNRFLLTTHNIKKTI